MKQIIIKYILARLKEASTWRGIIMLIAGTWATQHPEQAEAIIPIAIAIVGSIGAFLPDKKTPAVESDVQEYQGDYSYDEAPKPAVKRVPQKEPSEVQPSSGWGDKS